MLKTSSSVRRTALPIYVQNVADVKLGNAFRTGALDKNGKEAVGGVVIARYGVNTLEVIERSSKRSRRSSPDCRRACRSFLSTIAPNSSSARRTH